MNDHFDRVLRFWSDRGWRASVWTRRAGGRRRACPTNRAGDDAKATEQAGANVHVQFLPKAHDYWRRWRHLVDDYEAEHPGRRLVTVSEAYTPGKPELLLKFVEPDQFHQSFSFDLMLAPGIAGPIRQSVAEVHRVLTAAGATLTWTLNNHDTQRVVTRYGRVERHLRPRAGRRTTWCMSMHPSTRSSVCVEPRR